MIHKNTLKLAKHVFDVKINEYIKYIQTFLAKFHLMTHNPKLVFPAGAGNKVTETVPLN